MREKEAKKNKSIMVVSGKKSINVSVDTILYIMMNRNTAEIHLSDSRILKTRMTLCELLERLGEGFILIHRSCLVSVIAIHEIGEQVCLVNGECLNYVKRRKQQLELQLQECRKKIIASFAQDDIPRTKEAYFQYYASFDRMPFAFADIEMMFDDENHAVDWIFRYGNARLARLEKLPLEKMINHSFHELFPNMDAKWLTSYERSALYGETLEVIDYSPEIDTYIKVICFPTFRGHCGCILFDLREIEFSREISTADRALMLYLGNFSKDVHSAFQKAPFHAEEQNDA